MDTIENLKKAFHESRIELENQFSDGRISFDTFQAAMLYFEYKLRAAGVNL